MVYTQSDQHRNCEGIKQIPLEKTYRGSSFKLWKSLVQSKFSEVYYLPKSGRRPIHHHISNVFVPRNFLLGEQYFFRKCKTTYLCII